LAAPEAVVIASGTRTTQGVQRVVRFVILAGGLGVSFAEGASGRPGHFDMSNDSIEVQRAS
jgi:hypothetical protein